MELTDEQFSLIKEQFKTLKERSPFYAKKFEGIDLSDVQTQEDFEKLPKRRTCERSIHWDWPPCPRRRSFASILLLAPRAFR